MRKEKPQSIYELLLGILKKHYDSNQLVHIQKNYGLVG